MVVYHRIRQLGTRHDITLLTFYERDEELEQLHHLRPHCHDIVAVRLPRWRSLGRVFIGSLINPLPLQVLYYDSKSFRQAVERLVRRERYDVVHTYLVRLAQYGHTGGRAHVIELVDSMSRALGSELPHLPWPRRLFVGLERARIAPYERQMIDLYDAAFVVSDADRAEIGAAKIHVVPNGVDTASFCPPTQPPVGSTIMFSGNMGYGPNRRAARWFAECCFPRIKQICPDAEFVIVGARPPREIRALAKDPSVTIKGFVPSVAKALQEATVVVAPMQSGSGIQNKLLEAMATSRAVVTTPRGLGGIQAKGGQHLLVAETSDAFVLAVTGLLRDRDLVAKIGDAARAYVAAHHSWETSARRIEKVYECILN